MCQGLQGLLCRVLDPDPLRCSIQSPTDFKGALSRHMTTTQTAACSIRALLCTGVYHNADCSTSKTNRKAELREKKGLKYGCGICIGTERSNAKGVQKDAEY